MIIEITLRALQVIALCLGAVLAAVGAVGLYLVWRLLRALGIGWRDMVRLRL